MTFLVTLCVFVAWAYWMTHGHSWNQRTMVALLIGGFGAMAAYDGITLAVQEHAHTYDGRVVTGVVLEKRSAADADDSRRTRRRRWRLFRTLTTEGTRVHDLVGRLILTGSPRPWIVEYRYPCGGPYFCRGKDFVPETLWRRLHVGETADVRLSQSGGELTRLDENPRWPMAIVDLSMAGVLLLTAGVVSGRLTSRRRRYVTAPAVVTAVEPVQYLGATRLRIRFAYLDADGAAQESADEIGAGAWKPGDDCLAVFSPERPDLATFRPVQPA